MASAEPAWQLSTYVTVGVIGGGMLVGLLVICIVCGCCTIFNRKYDLAQLDQKKRRVSLQTISVVQSRPSPGQQRAYSLASPPRPILIVRKPTVIACRPSPENINGFIGGNLQTQAVSSLQCEHCSPTLPVQVTRTTQGGTVTSVLPHGCACSLFIRASRSEYSISGSDLRQLASSSEAIYMGDCNNVTTANCPASCGANPADGRDEDATSLLQQESRDTDPLIATNYHDSESSTSLNTGSNCRTVHVHRLLHPHFHAHSKDDPPLVDGTDDLRTTMASAAITHVDVHRACNPLMSGDLLQLPSNNNSSQSLVAVSPMSDYETSQVEEAVTAGLGDPCIALWGLRSVLEQRTGCKPEPVIRLIAESDNELELEPSGGVSGQQLQPGSILTSLTSFESNTPSEESFDASSCAKALEAIFDEPSDLPLGHGNPHYANLATHLYSSSTHLTPPVRRQQRKPSPPKLTSHQKRQSFKKAHRLATGTASVKRVTAPTVNVEPATDSLPAKSASVEMLALSVDCSVAESEGSSRSPSPHRLQQMKNDSGYKSQSLDQGSSTAQTVHHIHAFKSVPSLVHGQPVVDALTAAMDMETGRMERFDNDCTDRANGHFFLSASDLETEDAASCHSSLVPSLTSSMELEAAFARIPLLLTQPATPTTPPPRDWTIDERSDRLFREFNQRDPVGGASRSRSLRSPSRPHRPLLPKRKSYSPSSSHTGTPAQASIEEEEDEAPSSGSTVEKGLTPVPTPDFFVCTTKEQLLSHIHMRTQSPELRHVPIIKLPDQESDDV